MYCLNKLNVSDLLAQLVSTYFAAARLGAVRFSRPPTSKALNVSSWPRAVSRRLCFPLVVLCAFCLWAPIALSQKFTIIALPDAQNEAEKSPSMLDSQMQWIIDNRTGLNIQMVLGEGDIVNDGADSTQLANADAAIRLLDGAGVPYLLAIGNHDYDGHSPNLSRSVTGFNQWFGPTRWAAYPFYKGNFPAGSNENSYGVLTINGVQYLFLMLEFRPRSTSLDWAESILSANAGMKAIVVNHSFLLETGSREDRCDTQDMPLPANANGEMVWQRLRKHPNVIMVLNGHYTKGTTSHRTDLGDNGNLINQVFTNFQDTNNGNGWLRIFTFDPASNNISVQTYSPFIPQSLTDLADQFTLNINNPHPTTGKGYISGMVRNAFTCAPISGATVSVGGISTTTAADGTYKLTIAPGKYTFSALATGFNGAAVAETVNDSLYTEVNFYPTPIGAPPCPLSPVSPSVTICTPNPTSSLLSPVTVVGGTTDSTPVSFVQIYVDGSAKVTNMGNSITAQLAMLTGTHRLTVQAKDGLGTIFKQTESIVVCNVGPTSPSVTICSPASGVTVKSPVHVVAATTDSVAVSYIQVYVDGSAVYTKTGGTLDANIAMALGSQRVTVQAKDSAGVIFKQTIYITVQ